MVLVEKNSRIELLYPGKTIVIKRNLSHYYQYQHYGQLENIAIMDNDGEKVLLIDDKEYTSIDTVMDFIASLSVSSEHVPTLKCYDKSFFVWHFDEIMQVTNASQRHIYDKLGSLIKQHNVWNTREVISQFISWYDLMETSAPALEDYYISQLVTDYKRVNMYTKIDDNTYIDALVTKDTIIAMKKKLITLQKEIYNKPIAPCFCILQDISKEYDMLAGLQGGTSLPWIRHPQESSHQ